MSQSSTWTPRGGSDGGPPFGEEGLAHLLDRAHAELGSQDLAALLLAVRRMIQPPERLASEAVLAGAGPRLSPPPRERLGPCTLALAGVATTPGGLEWLDEYLDEVASRPRGSASAG